MSDKEITINIVITPEDIDKKQYTCNEALENEEICNLSFSSEMSLKKHILLIHCKIDIIAERSSKIAYQYPCPIATCRRNLFKNKEYFSSRKHLLQHFYKSHNTKEFNCSNDCGKHFATELLRNIHLKSCGKVFKCDFCNCCYNSNEALITHRKRKNHLNANKVPKTVVKRRKVDNSTAVSTRSVATTTTSTIATSKSISTLTDNLEPHTLKLIKSSSTSTDDFGKEENSNSLSSSSSQNKKTNVSWNITGGEFEEDSITLFDSDVKMEFYSAETQTDFSLSLFNNNYTQTTFADFDDFEKFDNQTQTNWDDDQGF